MQPDTSLFKGKIAAQNRKIAWENERPRRKPKQPGRNVATTAVAATMAHGVHHGQAVVGSGRARSPASQTLRFVHLFG